MRRRLIEGLDDRVAVLFKHGKGFHHRIQGLHSKCRIVSASPESRNAFVLALDTRLDRSNVPIHLG
jgi:hypothetical protein